MCRSDKACGLLPITTLKNLTSVIEPIILKRLYQLFNCLIDRKVIGWSFFISRFEIIINEIQNYNSHQKHLQESVLLLKREESPSNSQPENKKKNTNTEVRSLSANLKFP